MAQSPLTRRRGYEDGTATQSARSELCPQRIDAGIESVAVAYGIVDQLVKAAQRYVELKEVDKKKRPYALRFLNRQSFLAVGTYLVVPDFRKDDAIVFEELEEIPPPATARTARATEAH